jgi:outer membrane protein assembly factor BamB
LVPVDGGEHLVLSGIGHLVGLDPANGEVLWKFDGIAGNSTPTPFPVGKGRFLIGATVGRGEESAGKASDSNGLIEIKKGDDGKYAADFVWRAQKATSSFGSPIAHAGRAYFVNASGVLFCLDLETGDEQFNARIGDSLWATPLPLGDRLCLAGKNGTVAMIVAGSKLEKLGENTVWEANAPPPMAEGARRPPGGGSVLYAAIAVDGKLLIRRGDALYCVGK